MVHSDAPQMRSQPRRALFDVGAVPGFIADGRKANELLQLRDEAATIAAGVADGARRFHGGGVFQRAMLWPEIDDWGRNARRGSKQAWRAGAFEPQKRCRKLEERNISRSLP
jgi:hypothetical protein